MSRIKSSLEKSPKNTIAFKILLAEIEGYSGDVERPELENEIYLKIDEITDYYNGLPPFTMLLEELSKPFTFDEIFCNINAIKHYHRYLESFDL